MNAFELLGRAIGTFCSWLGYIVGRLFRRRTLAATVVVGVIAGGVWIIAEVAPQIISLWKTVIGGTVALADCKFPIPRKGEVGPACKCRTVHYEGKTNGAVTTYDKSSLVYLPNKDDELIAPSPKNWVQTISDSWIWVYNVSPKFPKYLLVQTYDTVIFDPTPGPHYSQVCDRDDPKYAKLCTVGLIAADQIAENSCQYER